GGTYTGTIQGLGNVIDGGAGDDQIYGNEDTFLFGGDGNDSLRIVGDGYNTSSDNGYWFGDSNGGDYYGYVWIGGGGGNDTYTFDPSFGNLGTFSIYEDSNSDSDTLDFSHFSSSQPVNIDIGSTSSQTLGNNALTLNLSDGSAIENVIGTPGDDYII